MTRKFKKLFGFSLILALSLRVILQLIVVPAFGPRWLWFWGNFDGVHYLRIAEFGYQSALTQAFFPFYPILIKFFTLLFKNPLASSLTISHLSLVGFLYYFIKLGLLDFKPKTIQWAVILLLVFPTSFFLFGTYTESLFLFLVSACFYYMRSKKFFLSALLAGLASATSLVGIFLLPAILIEYIKSQKTKNYLKLAGLSLLSSSGLLFYLSFLQKHFNDLFIFIHSQPGFGSGRQADSIVLIYRVIARYIRMFFGVSLSNEIYPVLIFEFIVAMAFLSLIIWALIKKFRLSYLLFIIPVYLLPTLTGSFSSMPRYVLATFPLFYLLGGLKSKKTKLFLVVLFTLLLPWAFIRFARGYWVS